MKWGFGKALQHQLWYVPLLAFAMGLMFVRLLVMARLLGLTSFGHFNAGLLVSSTFCILGSLGLQSMLQRDLPILIVHRRERPGLVLLGQCLIVAAICAVLGIVAAAFGLSVSGLSPAIIAVGVLHGFSQQVFLIATVESRSRGEPLRFALQNLVRAVAALVVGAVLAGITGSAIWCLLAEALVSLLLTYNILLAVFRRTGMHIHLLWCIAVQRLKHLEWRSAVTLFSVSLVTFVLMNADRWLAASLMDAQQFAQYAFAWLVLMIAQSLQAIINAAAYTTVARRFAMGGRMLAFRLSAKASLVMLLGGGLLAIPVWLLLRAIIDYWYPDYGAAQVLLPLFLGIAVLRSSDFWTSYLLIIGRETRLLWLNLAASLVGAIFWLAHRELTLPTNLLSAGLLAGWLALWNYFLIAAVCWYEARKK